ncbi:MAG TPA: flavodoxin domain-containing protein [Actinomycetota bacterium]|nr:flavodoxin domain-containing protein [Actinomycetota bacterium]
MNAVVVYESLYGNTAAIGEAIAEGLRASGLETESGPISRISPERAATFDLLVVGGPTHQHGMSKPATRRTAVEDAANAFADPTVEPGLSEWLTTLPESEGRLGAAFDTRIDKPVFLTGSAAKGIAPRLQGSGFRLLTRPESFLVTMKNRLREGEIDRARRWGTELGELAPVSR